MDLSRQLMWVASYGRVTFGPAPIRSGRRGFATRDGMFHVYWRQRQHYSTEYHVWMPYAQFFDGGIAFHGYAFNIHTPPGSHGCVNMREGDARALWSRLELGDPVLVFGVKGGR